MKTNSTRLVVPFVALMLVCGITVSLAPSISAQEPVPLTDAEAELLDEAGPTPAESETPETNETKPSIPQNPQEILEALGWPFVAPFLAASFISLWFGLERLVVLRRGRVIPRAFVDRFIKHLEQGKIEPQKALDLCEDNGSPTAVVFAHGVRKWGRPSVEVEQAILDGGERQVSLLRKHLRVLNGVATVTPLIGLLGTVIGMIRAFNEIAGADAMGKASQLASGIALALLTTAAGLIIAIPSLILYMYLAGKVDSVVMDMDRYAQRVVELISSEGLTARGNDSPSVSKKAS
ncbi:MotA/TolQ/ExbB proton channel family protein [Planctomycetaceae bacterium]|jgi:biopolymer transport protein ExbB|nr:MotA/TolQ/ExbB proton channel family protein [Planctomycetaceae bacterium]MDC0261629.1 MotA/TolQ/ExbB proton channel family protein [Planctomycetaceae bacterium]MDC0308561.1 MotA/TolQ/ExbB proton channel family protein [Planctomycetaceae bacterium]MDG2391532.1 MotA/TolQ/ExbB proton channel family protein [Planctomycetaceae bacterium]